VSKKEKTCDICGRPILGKPITKYIEGAKLQVCSNCSKFGKSVKPSRTPGTYKPKAKKRKKLPYQRSRFEKDFILIENYGETIRKARERKKWTQDEFARKLKEPLSLIKRIEKNKINPSVGVVKKIEKLLGISLTEMDIEEDIPQIRKKSKSSSITLGDIVEIKKKKD